ncbi:hypothetical protein HG530_014824 [Fusarium avenaceum]|nr:hypothetical protein HG530_014824 [Fusarium avenaceum]
MLIFSEINLVPHTTPDSTWSSSGSYGYQRPAGLVPPIPFFARSRYVERSARIGSTLEKDCNGLNVAIMYGDAKRRGSYRSHNTLQNIALQKSLAMSRFKKSERNNRGWIAGNARLMKDISIFELDNRSIIQKQLKRLHGGHAPC